jgi:hypothetical protein
MVPDAVPPSFMSTRSGVPTALIMTLSQRPIGSVARLNWGPTARGYMGRCPAYRPDSDWAGYMQPVAMLRNGTRTSNFFMTPSSTDDTGADAEES